MNDLTIPATPSAYDFPLNLRNLFNNPIVNNPQQEIVYRDLRRHNYTEFRQRVARLANALSALGVKPGDTVAVMDYDSHRYLECYYAIPMLGAVLHMVNVRLSPEQILYTIDHAEDDILLVHSDFLPLLEPIKGRIDTIHAYVLLQDEDLKLKTSFDFVGEYEQLLADAEPDFDFLDLDENSRATTFYTTGTTGMPKGVYFSHRQLVLHTLGVLAALGTNTAHGNFHREDVYMPITPMFHVHAWGLPFVATTLGVKQVYPGRYVPDMLLKLIAEEKVTFSHCVPTILHMLLTNNLAKTTDLSAWKIVIGGSAMSKALCQQALACGIDVFTGYGMSETCPILSLAQLTPEMLAAPPEEQAELRCKTGRTLPLVELQLVDEALQPVAADGESVGEIVVRAPWLTQGYYKDQHNSENLWKGGYLHTGDVANRDRQGFIKITDRAKDVIKIAGEWVSSLELEDILARHECVSEVAVIGSPDPKWGEKPLALVVKHGKSKTCSKDLKAHLQEFVSKGMINRHALICQIMFVESIDKTSVGKVDKRSLRSKFL